MGLSWRVEARWLQRQPVWKQEATLQHDVPGSSRRLDYEAFVPVPSGAWGRYPSPGTDDAIGMNRPV